MSSRVTQARAGHSQPWLPLQKLPSISSTVRLGSSPPIGLGPQIALTMAMAGNRHNDSGKGPEEIR